MIVSITDSLDDDDDYRKEGSKGGGRGRGSYARTFENSFVYIVVVVYRISFAPFCGLF